MGKIQVSFLIFLLLLTFVLGICTASNSQTASLGVISSIKLNSTPYSLAVNQETNRIYIGANNGTGYSIIVVDGITKQIVTTVPLVNNSEPQKIAIDSGINRIFVMQSSVNITVIDGASNNIIGILPLTYTGYPTDISVDSQHHRVYVGIKESTYYNVADRIQIYDSQTLSLLNYISISGTQSTAFHSVYVAINEITNRLFATWSGNRTIFVYDASTRQLLQTTEYISPSTAILGVDPSTNRIYLTNETIDGNSLVRAPQFNIGYMISNLAFDANFNVIYGVRNKFNGSYNSLPFELIVADALTGKTIGTLNLDNSASYSPKLAANIKTGEIYLTDYLKNQITLIQGLNQSKPLLASNLSISPFKVQIGQQVTISYLITNVANTAMTYSPTISVNDSTLQQESIVLASRESRNLTFTTTVNIAGTYAVTAESLIANFTAEMPSSTIAFMTNGMGNDTGSATILTIDSIPYSYSQLQSLSFNWVIGSNHTIASSATVSAGLTKHYTFVSWTNGDGLTGTSGSYMVPASNTNVTINWKTQYQLTVTSTYGSPTGQGWYDSGSSATFGISTPVSGGAQIQYVFTTWSGTGSGSYTGANNSQSLTMNNAITETASWQIQYQVSFNTNPSFGGSTNPSGITWQNAGANSVNAASSPGYSFSSWSTTGSITVYQQSSVTTTATINGPGTITANFQPQPSPTPTAQPSPTPTAQPSPTPTAQPSPTPTAQPSPTPTAQPSPTPTAQPSPTPTAQPSPTPTKNKLQSPSPSQLSQSNETPLYLYGVAFLAILGISATIALILKKRRHS